MEFLHEAFSTLFAALLGLGAYIFNSKFAHVHKRIDKVTEEAKEDTSELEKRVVKKIDRLVEKLDQHEQIWQKINVRLERVSTDLGYIKQMLEKK